MCYLPEWKVKHADTGEKNEADFEITDCSANDDREAVLGLCLIHHFYIQTYEKAQKLW